VHQKVCHDGSRAGRLGVKEPSMQRVFYKLPQQHPCCN
jgi:hypothetical protein